MIFEGLDDRLWMHPDITNVLPRDADTAWVIMVNRGHNVLGSDAIFRWPGMAPGPSGKRMAGTLADKLLVAAALEDQRDYRRPVVHARLKNAGVDLTAISSMVKCRTTVDVTLGLWTWEARKFRSIAHWVDPGFSGFTPAWVPQNDSTLAEHRRFMDTCGFSDASLQAFMVQCSARRAMRRTIARNIKWIYGRIPFATDKNRLYIPTDRKARSKREVYISGWDALALKLTAEMPQGYTPLAYASPEVLGTIIRNNAEIMAA